MVTEVEGMCVSVCVPVAQAWKTAQPESVYCDGGSCVILCYSVVSCKTYSSKKRTSFCAQNFLQCVLNFTEQEPKPQKLGSLKTLSCDGKRTEVGWGWWWWGGAPIFFLSLSIQDFLQSFWRFISSERLKSNQNRSRFCESLA